MAHKPESDCEVVYCAPTSEVLNAFARQVCRRLGTPYLTPEVMAGFSALVRAVAEVEVKVLNREGKNAALIDKP